MADIESESAPLLGENVSVEVVKIYPPSLLAKLTTEFIGTFMLVLTVALTVSQTIADPNFKDTALAIGTVLAVMVYMGGHISGANYNPAVTLALALCGEMQWVEAGMYAAVQCAGGLVAALLGYAITGVAWSPAPGAKYTLYAAFGAEALFTFALCLVVLNVACVADNANAFFGYSIGMIVFVGATSVGSISGAVFNPAVGTGIIMVDTMFGGFATYLWLYWVAPCAGAGLAALVFRLTNPGKFK